MSMKNLPSATGDKRAGKLKKRMYFEEITWGCVYWIDRMSQFSKVLENQKTV